MKFRKSIIAALLLIVVAPLTFGAVNPKPFVVPELKSWKGGEGVASITAQTKIVCASADASLTKVAQEFAADYKAMFGQQLTTATGKSAKGDIVLAIKKNKKLGKEGYTIRLGESIVVTAPTATGIYWATRTLLQMTEKCGASSLPKGFVEDYPDYPLRGFLIDCGRKYIPMSYLDNLVKVLAYYKMNTLSVHLNDNGFVQYFDNDWNKTYAAFRLESDTYPGLTARDGSYSKKEFIRFQKDAADRCVEIIPEIDVPAHSLAFTHYKPEIGSKEYGMDHLDLFNPETYNFVDGLFKEYLEGPNPVFCGRRVNIGTDEYSNKKKEVVEKFRAFADRYIRYVESFGKQACMWGSLTHAKGDTPVKAKNVVMGAWYNGYAEPKEMIKEGYQLISMPDGYLYIVPAAGYYYDYLNEPMLFKEWTPAHIGKEVFDEKNPSILGGMFAEWNDHVGNGITVKDIHHRVFPAIQTLSMKMWNAQLPSMSYETYDAGRTSLSEAPGVNELGKIKGEANSVVYEQAEVLPDSKLPYTEIGYNYTVSFDITAAAEVPGTELFRSPNAVFYLSDPIQGMMGFSGNGYLNTFSYQLRAGEKAHIDIKGDNMSTSLYVDGNLVENLKPAMRYYKNPKDTMLCVSTLVFPLEHSGAFKSKVSNLKVYNYLTK